MSVASPKGQAQGRAWYEFFACLTSLHLRVATATIHRLAQGKPAPTNKPRFYSR